MEDGSGPLLVPCQPELRGLGALCLGHLSSHGDAGGGVLGSSLVCSPLCPSGLEQLQQESLMDA